MKNFYQIFIDYDFRLPYFYVRTFFTGIMNRYADIPVTIDFFAVVIFLGLVQGFLLSIVFFTQKTERGQSSKFLGAAIATMTLLGLEIFLCYTGIIMKVLHLVDFSQSIAFLIGPFFYFFVKSRLNPEFRFSGKQYAHFGLFAFYSVYMILFIVQPETVKYNAFISSFHPDLPRISIETAIDGDPLLMNRFHSVLVIIQTSVYSVMTARLIINAFRESGTGLFSQDNPNLALLRQFVLMLVLSAVLLAIIKAVFEFDVGDHLIGAWLSIMLYLMTITVIRQSLFFREQPGKQKKYHKSSLTDGMLQDILKKLETVMQEEKLYLDDALSLPVLAKNLSVSQHHLSQALNVSMNRSFFEYIAELRIEEAKKLLSQKDAGNKTIEEISFAVGYNSKSAFNTAFKKLTGLTPAQYRKENSN